MEDLNITQILIFSLLAYLFGFSSGKKHGFVKAIKSIPVTVLQVSDELSLEEVSHEK